MTLKKFGKTIRDIRKDILNLNQKEFAEALGTKQAIISRLELGIGCNYEIIFQLMSYLQSKQIKAYMIFQEPFDFSSLITDNKTEIQQKIKELNFLIDKL